MPNIGKYVSCFNLVYLGMFQFIPSEWIKPFYESLFMLFFSPPPPTLSVEDYQRDETIDCKVSNCLHSDVIIQHTINNNRYISTEVSSLIVLDRHLKMRSQ